MAKPINLHTFPSYTVQHDSAKFIADFLSEKLARPVLLLLSGGSAIAMYKEMFDLLIEKTSDLNNLTVSLFDERFVPITSVDSNEYQLQEAGIIDLLLDHGTTWIPYLSSHEDENGSHLSQRMHHTFTHELSGGKNVIILAGMGDDGHTAGMLPVDEDSPNRPRLFQTNQFVTYYQVETSDSNNPFSHRLTATPALIKKADHIFLYTTGEKKRRALHHFLDQDGEIYQYPVISLHQSKNPVEVLTDITHA